MEVLAASGPVSWCLWSHGLEHFLFSPQDGPLRLLNDDDDNDDDLSLKHALFVWSLSSSDWFSPTDRLDRRTNTFVAAHYFHFLPSPIFLPVTSANDSGGCGPSELNASSCMPSRTRRHVHTVAHMLSEVPSVQSAHRSASRAACQ